MATPEEKEQPEEHRRCAAFLLAQMDYIMQNIPLTHDYNEDGRDTWPNRWRALRERVEILSK